MKLFKDYQQGVNFLFPPNVEEMIPGNHIVRLVNEIIEKLDISEIENTYKGGGATAYHPLMLLKTIVFGYIDGIFTSRVLAKAMHENINYMWLSGMQTPDFRTINNFRSGKLKDKIKGIFKQVVEIALELGYISFEKVFVDGTKIEANSNKYKITYRKNIQRYKENVENKINGILEDIDKLCEEEDKIYGNKNLPEIGEEINLENPETKKEIEKAINKINEKIRSNRNEAGKLNKRVENYEKQEEILGDRNSYSKTDNDATAMKMKDDQFKPGYNVMIATENQVILNYEVEQKPGDCGCFVKLMNGVNTSDGTIAQNVCGDQAFGSEENYNYCEQNGINSYLKFSSFRRENTKKYKENKYLKENFKYDEINNCFTCSAGKILYFKEECSDLSKNGYMQNLKIYECNECKNCEQKKECTPGQNRSIRINSKLESYKSKAREMLNSEFGKEIRNQRSTDVETVFGNLKQNNGFRRFLLRGLKKVTIEMGLMAIMHNIKKIKSFVESKTRKMIQTQEIMYQN